MRCMYRHRPKNNRMQHREIREMAGAMVFLAELHKDDDPPKKVGLIERVMRILQKI